MESKRVEHPDRIEYVNDQGQPHRLDGPAIEWVSGGKEWYINGKCHREDGPAIIFNVIEYYYLNDINYTRDQFNQEVIKLKLKRLINEERISR